MNLPRSTWFAALILCSGILLTASKRGVLKAIADNIFKTTISIKTIECFGLDPAFLRVDRCEVKTISKASKVFSLRIKLLQPPLRQVNMSFAIVRLENKQKSVVNNITMDFCEYLSTQNHPIFGRFFDSFKDYTNVNHSCPLDESDIIVENVPIKIAQFPLAFSAGHYLIEVQVSVFKTPRFKVELTSLVKG